MDRPGMYGSRPPPRPSPPLGIRALGEGRALSTRAACGGMPGCVSPGTARPRSAAGQSGRRGPTHSKKSGAFSFSGGGGFASRLLPIPLLTSLAALSSRSGSSGCREGAAGRAGPPSEGSWGVCSACVGTAFALQGAAGAKVALAAPLSPTGLECKGGPVAPGEGAAPNRPARHAEAACTEGWAGWAACIRPSFDPPMAEEGVTAPPPASLARTCGPGAGHPNFLARGPLNPPLTVPCLVHH